jgi:hypothetical protein
MMYISIFPLVLAFVVPFLLLKSLGNASVYPSESFANTQLPTSTDVHSSRILLLTAHPDDESLFFAPTILALVNQDTELHLMCLSDGDADGIGHLRSKEIEDSWDVLGVDSRRRILIDSPYARTFAGIYVPDTELSDLVHLLVQTSPGQHHNTLGCFYHFRFLGTIRPSA